MSDEFFSFDEALNELRLKEEELKRLVSEGEIRAFRKGDTMKLRRSDVESLRSELQGGEVVDLGEMTEELVFEDDSALDDGAGMATEEISNVDTLIDDVEDVGTLDLEIDEIEDLELVDEAEEDIIDIAGGPVRRGAAAGAEDEEEMLPSWAVGLVLVTSVVLILFIPVAIGLSTGRASGVAKAIGGIFSKSLSS